MADQAQQDPPEKSPKGYGKRPLWQWVLLYLVVGAIVYGLVYYFFFMPSGSVSY
jgi:hypothetical protein